jgi:ATP-dependent DNA ligase
VLTTDNRVNRTRELEKLLSLRQRGAALSCGSGLEGIVSKRKDAPYRSGVRSGWVKVKTSTWRAANRETVAAL